MGTDEPVTVLLRAWRRGDRDALDRLMPLVYQQIRAVAAAYLRRERSSHSWSSGDLVAEAFVRLVGEQQPDWEDRSHFFGIAARLMRQVLVDHARPALTEKRGSGESAGTLDEELVADQRPDELLAHDEALAALAEHDGRKARVIEMSYFGGMSQPSIAKLGQGGMGAVYLAVRDDDQYRAEVAIKLLHQGLETAAAVARFRDERQILAGLDHPGIVRLLDGGSTADGLPYLVMERVDGVPITVWAREKNLSVRARVQLFRTVCDAVTFAHQRLDVHRDLKPSNILVTADGQPKLLDFRNRQAAGWRRRGRPRGAHRNSRSPALDSRLRQPGADTPTRRCRRRATHLFAGRCPLRAPGRGARVRGERRGLEALRAVLEADPARPSAVAPSARRGALAGDLDNIVLKALAKEPNRRYASVEQLQADLGRYLDGLPVEARAGTFGYRAGKFVRRNRGAIAAAIVVVTALSSATVVSLRQAQRADEQARRADSEARRGAPELRRRPPS